MISEETQNETLLQFLDRFLQEMEGFDQKRDDLSRARPRIRSSNYKGYDGWTDWDAYQAAEREEKCDFERGLDRIENERQDFTKRAAEDLLSRSKSSLKINEKNGYNDTGLMVALEKDVFIQEILQFKPDINIQNYSRDTALMIALRQGLSFEGILNLNPNLLLKNDEGKTALDIAEECASEETNRRFQELVSKDEIIFKRKLDGKKLKEIFDFVNKERISLYYEDEKRPPSFIRTEFSDIRRSPQLRNAFEERARRMSCFYGESSQVSKMIDKSPMLKKIKKYPLSKAIKNQS